MNDDVTVMQGETMVIDAQPVPATYPMVCDLDRLGDEIEEHGITGPFEDMQVYVFNWPRDRAMPEEIKDWIRRGEADGTLTVHYGDPPVSLDDL